MTTTSDFVNEELAKENERLRKEVEEAHKTLEAMGKQITKVVEDVVHRLSRMERRLEIIEANTLMRPAEPEPTKWDRPYRATWTNEIEVQTHDDFGNAIKHVDARLKGLEKVQKRRTK